MEFTLLEDYPIYLVSEMATKTGHNGSEVFVLTMRYHPDFSGPRVDTFGLNRATADVSKAHLSNFLHPVVYYYEDVGRGTKRDAVV